MVDSSRALLWLQICGMVAMFASTFLSYLLPIFVFSRRNRRLQNEDFTTEEDLQMPHHWSNVNLTNQLKKYRLKRLLSCCNCISAGVFLGVCFLNLIPCVEEEFARLIKDFAVLQKYFGSFPLGQFTVICGLFLVLILESLLSRCFGNGSKQAHLHSSSSSSVPILYLDEESGNEPRSDLHDELNCDQEELLLSNEHREERNLNGGGGNQNRAKNVHNGHGAVHPNAHENLFADTHHQHHGHHHLTADLFQDKPDSMLSFFILMFATSIHSLFEGLALGLQTDMSTAIHLFIGIILHECLVAAALGLNAVRLQQQNINLLMHIKFAFLFSLTIPVGNVFGILLGFSPGHFGRFISAIFQGFAAGTFIHVTFIELIPEELLSPDCDIHEDELIRMMGDNTLDNAPIGVNTNLESAETSDTVRGAALSTANLTHESSDRSQRHRSSGQHSHHMKLRKILLLLLGFIIMTLVPFIFGE